MSAPLATTFRVASLAACVAASAGVSAATLTVNIPPSGPKYYSYSQCASFTLNGSVLTCVPNNQPPTPPTNPQPPTTPGTPFAGCPSNTLMIDNAWGNSAISTFDYGYFGANILSVRVVVPATATGTRTQVSSWVEYGTAAFAREAVLSTVACDFSTANALRNGMGQPAKSAPDTIGFSFAYTTGPAGRFSFHLEPGQTYYLNVRNRYSDGTLSCPLVACSMRGGFPQ